MANTNPYEPQLVRPVRPADVQTNAIQATARALIAWPLVLVSNLVFPWLLASSLIRERGKIGLLTSVLLFAIAGWALIMFRPKQGTRLVVGAAILIATQLVPVIQIVAGSIAFNIAQSLRQAQIGDGEGLNDRITSEWGGFIVTSVTGSLLACVAFVFGVMALAVRNAFSDFLSPKFLSDRQSDKK